MEGLSIKLIVQLCNRWFNKELCLKKYSNIIIYVCNMKPIYNYDNTYLRLKWVHIPT